MSITNLQVLTHAYQKAGIISEGGTPSAEQGQVALRLLNQMMAEWEIDGLEFPSWFPQTANSDTCPIPEFAELAVSNKLAVLLCTEYGVAASAELGVMARMSYDAVLRKRANQRLRPVDLNIADAEGGYYYRDITAG